MPQKNDEQFATTDDLLKNETDEKSHDSQKDSSKGALFFLIGVLSTGIVISDALNIDFIREKKISEQEAKLIYSNTDYCVTNLVNKLNLKKTDRSKYNQIVDICINKTLEK